MQLLSGRSFLRPLRDLRNFMLSNEIMPSYLEELFFIVGRPVTVMKK